MKALVLGLVGMISWAATPPQTTAEQREEVLLLVIQRVNYENVVKQNQAQVDTLQAQINAKLEPMKKLCTDSGQELNMGTLKCAEAPKKDEKK